MAIKELITLDGAQQVEAQLARINVAGEASIAQFNALGGATGDSFTGFTAGAAAAGTAVADTEQKTIRLSTQMRALKPVLADLGVSLGGIGGLARVANSSLALAGAAAGALATLGLAKLQENTDRAKGNLEDLFKSADKGAQAFNALQVAGEKFGAQVSELQPGLTALQTGIAAVSNASKGFVALKEEDLPGGGKQNVQLAVDAYTAFINVLRAGRLTQDDAQKAAEKFFNTFKDGQAITSSALKDLPIGTVNLLKEALGQAGASTQDFFARIDQGGVNLQNLSAALQKFAPQAQAAFDSKAIKTFGDEVQKLLATISTGFKNVTGVNISDALVQNIARLSQGLKDSAEEAAKLLAIIRQIESFTEIPSIGAIVQKLREAVSGGIKESTQGFDEAGFAEIGTKAAAAFKGTFGKSVDVSASLANLGPAGINAGNQIAQGLQKGTDAANALKEATGRLQSALQTLAQIQTQKQDVFSTVDIADLQAQEDRARRAAQEALIAQRQAGGDQGTQQGQQFGNKFVSAVETAVTQAAPQVSQSLSTALTPPADAQAELVNQFKDIGDQAGLSARQAVQAGLAQPPDLSALLGSFIDWAAQIGTIAQQAWQNIQDVFNNPILIQSRFQAPDTSTVGGFQPFAGGGQIRGPGTSTSDSILAWLSDREYVINARAVSHYGAGFFGALNAMLLPRDFSRALAPRGYAEGGQAQNGSGSSHTFILPSGQTFEATLTDQTVARLKRYSVKSRMASTGRKPGWVT